MAETGDIYDVVSADPLDGDYRCRSVVAVRRAAGLPAAPLQLRTARYHGSYVAVATVRMGELGEVTVVSAHASPTRPLDADVERWSSASDGVVPEPRPFSDGELWDADYLWATVDDLIEEGRTLLVAGDWNEARGWDVEHGGDWGREFFDRVQRSGLVDCTHTAWDGKERPTRGEFQIDHVFASPSVASRIQNLNVAPWPPSTVASDHHRLTFTLDLG